MRHGQAVGSVAERADNCLCGVGKRSDRDDSKATAQGLFLSPRSHEQGMIYVRISQTQIRVSLGNVASGLHSGAGAAILTPGIHA
jgi:hypothetical protein